MPYTRTGRRIGRPPGSRNKPKVRTPMTEPEIQPDSQATEGGPPPSRFPTNRPVDKAAAELAQKHALPQPPGKTLDWDQMQAYLALLTPEMWSHISIWLYRIRPRIIRQLKDPQAPNYIDCIGEKFDTDYIIERHGGGKYMIEATDSTATKRGESRHLFRCFFQIDEIRHEPKLVYEELDVNARENMSYIQMLQHRGTLDGKGQVVQNQSQSNNAAAGINADVIKEILGFVSKLNTEQQNALHSRLATDKDDLSKSVGNILLEKMKQDDPSKQVQMLSSLLTALKEIVGTSKSDGNSTLYDRIIQMQAEHNKTVLQLIERISQNNRPEANPEGTDEFDRLSKVLEFAEKLSAMRGGGGGHRNGWDIGLDYAKELGLPLMQTISNIFTLRRGGQPVPVGNPGAPGAFDPYANPQALRAHANTMNAQQPPPSMPMGTATASTPLMGLFQAYGGIVINALNNRTPGFEFADYVCGLMGDATHAMIANYGEDNIVQTMMTIPEFVMFGEPRLRTFTHEFIHFEEFLKESPEEGAPEQ